MKYTLFIFRIKAIIKYYLLKFFTYKKFRDELDILFKYFIKVKKQHTGIMLDVGAHLGEVSYNYLRAGFEVYAFEPDLNKTKMDLLNKLKRFKNFYLSHLAASDTSGKELDFYTSDVSSGISSALRFHDSHVFSGKVKTIAIEDFINDKGIKEIDFIKIDTEGYDFFVIKGLGLENIRPTFIICEYENAKSEVLGYKLQDMLNYLRKYDYKIIISEWYPIQRYGKKHNWKRFLSPPDLPDEKSWGNVFAIQSDYYDEFSEFIKRFKIK